MRRRLIVTAVAVLLLTLGAGVAAASTPPRLAASGPTTVRGTDATAVFRIGDHTVRQVRYRDHGTLVYSFVLTNHGPLPLTVTGMAPLEHSPTLFRYLALTDASGHRRFGLPVGESLRVRLVMRMTSCETLSARAGSFATAVAVRTSRAGLLDGVVRVTLPEEVHTGSPREASCPGSSATSRPPG